MKQSASLLIAASLIICAQAAPQISFKDGKLEVNFMGYHAGVGLGGGVNGGAAGGLFAEAGTPHGQKALAGLGGLVDNEGRATGGLYAGAAASDKVKASAGLAGSANGQKSVGGGFAHAQAGDDYDYDYVMSRRKGVPVTKVNEVYKYDTLNEINPPVAINKHIEIKTDVKPAVVVKEESFEAPVKVVEKEIVHTHVKPHRHHFRKTAYIATAPVFRNVEPQIQKRVDVVGTEGAANSADAVYTKQVTVQRNPTFFKDIFNIPISALKAVSTLVSNTAGNTNISVQKSASVHSELDSPKYDQSSVKSSAAHVSVETPSAAKFFDDIIAIPINTLVAVNKFLDNNVPAKKNVQVVDGEAVATRIRGPGKRRANKHVVVVQEDANTESIS